MTRQPLRADTPRHVPFPPYAATRTSHPAAFAAAAAGSHPTQLRAVVPLGRHGWAQRHPVGAGLRTH
ncbi:hypothetical protein, partial [Streptomyces sp. NRRL WC-3795]|uniref:hypothetical protein n=1 Tax=Streptomyces sp. NRRL WC-3795 TaxID=1463938 RepID=UPI001F2B198D